MKFEEFINWLNATEKWLYNANGVNKAHISYLRQYKQTTKDLVDEVRLYSRELSGVIKDLESDYSALSKIGVISYNKEILGRAIRRFIQAVDDFTTSFEDLSGIAEKITEKTIERIKKILKRHRRKSREKKRYELELERAEMFLKSVNEVLTKSAELKSSSEKFYKDIPVIVEGGKGMARAKGRLDPVKEYFSKTSKTTAEANKRFNEFEEAKDVLNKMISSEDKAKEWIEGMMKNIKFLEENLEKNLEIKTEEIKDLDIIIDVAKLIHRQIEISHRRAEDIERKSRDFDNRFVEVSAEWPMLSKEKQSAAKQKFQADLNELRIEVDGLIKDLKVLDDEIYKDFEKAIKKLNIVEKRDSLNNNLTRPLRNIHTFVQNMANTLTIDLNHNKQRLKNLGGVVA